MGKRPGEVSTTRAARILEVHVETVRRWCRGETTSPIERIRRDAAGRYWIDAIELGDLDHKYNSK